MGFAETLYKLGVRYSSEDGVGWGERFMQFVNDEAHDYSERLARERGLFPELAGEHLGYAVSPPDAQRLLHHRRPHRHDQHHRRLLRRHRADVQPGILPQRAQGPGQGKTPMIQIDPTFERVARERGFHSEGLMDQSPGTAPSLILTAFPRT